MGKLNVKEVKRYLKYDKLPVVMQFISTDYFDDKGVTYGKVYKLVRVYKRKNGYLNLFFLDNNNNVRSMDERLFKTYSVREDLNEI